MATTTLPGEPGAPERHPADRDEALRAEALRWLEDLPEPVRPCRLPAAYARIANEIARRWRDPDGCLAYLNDVLVDRRGTRQGFPMEVALELARLKSYYETVLYPTAQTVWDGIVARAHH